MTSYYVKGYEGKYGIKPNVNRYSARWGFDSLLAGMSKADAKEVVDYYFTTLSMRKHDLDWFFYNYEKLVESMVEGRAEAEHRKRLVEESRQRAEAWRNSGKSGIANSEQGSTNP